MKPSMMSAFRPLVPPFAAVLALLHVSECRADYPDLILSDNPMAYYRLEELPGSEMAFDSTANHFDAYYIPNSANDSPALGLPGITTNSIAFNGGSSYGYIEIPFHQELSPVLEDGIHGAPFSVEVWAQPTSYPTDYGSVLGMFGAYGSGIYSGASGWNFAQTPGPSGVWLFNMKNGPFAQAPGAIELNKWYHLAATFDGSTVIFYVNGVAMVTSGGNTGYLADNGADGQIGVTQNAGIPPYAPFSGGVDEVAFYTNVLTPAQILAHYQLGTNSFREVPTPPSFVQQPVSTTVYAGTPATFTALATGTTPLYFQWYRGATPIPNATNLSYSFTAAYPGDDGATFSVTVTNLVGSTNSPAVTLTVQTNLNILNDPYGPITRNVGSKAAFRVVAGGAQPITYQWYKISNSVPALIAGATNDTVWLSNVQPGDDGTLYYAHVTGPFGNADSGQALLSVQSRPVTVPVTGYARVVVADDPVAYWRLDEPDGSGVATDAVGSFDGVYLPNSGTLTYGVTNGIPHDTNTAISVSGGAIVTIPYALELNPVTGPWSFEAWIQPAIQPGDFATPLSSMYVVPGDIYGWNIYQHAASAWTMNMFAGGTGGSFNSDFFDIPLVIGAYYHLVIADDLTTIHFYVNGVERSTLDRKGFGFIPNGTNGDPSSGGATVLGHRGDSAFLPFEGSIDDVAVYNYALSAEQAQLHFKNTTKLTATKLGSNLVLKWGAGTLQAAPTVTGTYTNIAGATSPYTNSITGPQLFFRVQLQ